MTPDNQSKIDLGYCNIVQILESGWYVDEDYPLSGNEKVLEENDINIIISYPLETPATFSHTSVSDKGFTRRQLAEIIAKDYKQVYDEEEQTTNNEGMLNRNTGGKHGIYGHDLDDLMLHTAHVKKDLEGNVNITLEVDS